MRAYISLEHRFVEYQGELFTYGAFDQSFWQRYLDVFDEIVIVARVEKLSKLKGGEILVSSEQIKFVALSYYIGLIGKLKKHFTIKEELRQISNDKEAAYILRIGSPIADILAPMLRKNKISYAVEVVGDPWDVFAPGAIENPLRPLMRLYFAYKLKKQCEYASYASYVTEKALQKRYPPVRAKKTIHASSIDLGEDYFYKKDLNAYEDKTWLFVGTLEQYQKAPDVLIKAFAKVKNPSIELKIIGDGRKRRELEELVSSLSLSNVHFIGKLSSPQKVRKYLAESSFFVLPSRGEGLPRAMIEAMACSCVCIGSDIGGIKELIDDDFIAPAGNVENLAERIDYYSSLDKEDLLAIGERNYAVARSYLRDILNERRRSFYLEIKKGCTKG